MSAIRRILVPTDFSDLAVATAQWARSLVQELAAEVHLLYAVAPAPSDESLAIAPLPVKAEQLRSLLQDFAREHFPDLAVPPVVHLAIGLPVSVITEYAREKEIDLIVIGTHARGVLNRIFMGSVSKAVMERAPCPVLMVPWKRPAGDPLKEAPETKKD